MSMSFNPLETAEGSDFPGCRQLSIFLENRVGQLLRLTRLLEEEDIRILGLSVDAAVDYAIVRMVVSDPDAAQDTFVQNGFAVSDCELLIVELPANRRGILNVCAALISAEVNINYVYPIWSDSSHGQAIAVQVDNLGQASTVLHEKGFRVVSPSELRGE
ncbi:MAG: acetolactate synthase [Phycisphaerae bacterium]